ncbi:hypothetical protein FHETE_1666 [Fusarium heterosporum]|uniref:DUF6546 domain-containing protein n=1 Tax=Fusarium heterosporum TaxID=42747 RepID=A0A8H5X0B7_FUSHE|nr:hypothetical protein FHETE_1666 [Fusarium heterosporum]
MPHFDSFPTEIHNMILGFVPDSSSLANYATVCKTWQYFFEAKTFKSLILHQDDINDFSTIVKGHRKKFLKHLWLRVTLPKYLTPVCKVEESPKVLWEANNIFTESISNLWDILSGWDTPQYEAQSLTFELSVHSPSDWVEYIKEDSSIESDMPMYKGYLATESIDPYKNTQDVHSEYKRLQDTMADAALRIPSFLQVSFWMTIIDNLLGWKPLCFDNSTTRPNNNNPTYGSKDRATPASEQGTDEDEQLQLPEVPAITKLLIRRQSFRGICPTALGSILESLPNMQEIHVERWRCAEPSDEKMWCRGANITFGMDLPPSLKTLSLYGETSRLFHTWKPNDVNATSLTKSLRQYTKHLENLSVSHLIDAKEFFRPFWPADSDTATASLPRWEHLKTLSLTSEILNTDTKQDVNELLCAAARAARKMPNLELLELWNGRDQHAGVFRYRVIDSIGEVEWLSTSIESLDGVVIEIWKETSTILGRRFQRESASMLDTEDIGHTAAVLQHLDGRQRIMHPVSGYRAIQGL